MFIPLQVYHPTAIPDFVPIPSAAPLSPPTSPVRASGPTYPSQYHPAPPTLSAYNGYAPGEQRGYATDAFTPHVLPRAMSSPPRAFSPQHQFYFDAYSNVQQQYTPASGIPVRGLIMAPVFEAPPRPLSAGSSQLSLLDMPYALPYPEYSNATPLAPGLISSQPDQTPPQQNAASESTEVIVDDRASRISRHLRLTSRHRSVSPPRVRRSLVVTGIGVIPSRAPPQPTSLSSVDTTIPEQHLPQTPMSLANDAQPNLTSPPLLSPRPMNSPGRSYFDTSGSENGNIDRSGSGQRSPRVEELERIVLEQENQSTVASSSTPEPDFKLSSLEKRLEAQVCVDKTLPRPPQPSGRSTVARGLPAAAFADSTIDSAVVPSADSQAKLTVRDHERSADTGGLTLLERRLGRPAAYDIFQNQSVPASETVTYRGPAASASNSIVPSQNHKDQARVSKRPKPSPDDKRIRAKARVTAWLNEDPERHENRSPDNLKKAVGVNVLNAIQVQISPSSVAPGVHSESLLPKDDTSSDHASHALLKSKPHAAISSGLSTLDWRTLERVRPYYLSIYWLGRDHGINKTISLP